MASKWLPMASKPINGLIPGCMQLADDNPDINKKNNLRMSLCYADNYVDKISKEVAYELSVNRGK